MTDDTTTIAALRAALDAGPTDAPWRWEFNRSSKSMHIVGGRPRFDLTVMDFARWGMSSAVALFRDVAVDGMNIMHRLCDRADWIAPFPGRAHHVDWCAEITHPDARLMVAARNAAPELLAELDRLRSDRDCEKRLRKDAEEVREDAIEQRDRLAAEVAGRREDAERYRWLRAQVSGHRNPDSGRPAQFAFPGVMTLPPLADIMRGSVSQHLDAAIDAARTATAKEPT